MQSRLHSEEVYCKLYVRNGTVSGKALVGEIWWIADLDVASTFSLLAC